MSNKPNVNRRRWFVNRDDKRALGRGGGRFEQARTLAVRDARGKVVDHKTDEPWVWRATQAPPYTKHAIARMRRKMRRRTRQRQRG